MTLVATTDEAATLALATDLAPDILPALRPLLRTVTSEAALTVGGRAIPTGVCGVATRPPFERSAALTISQAPVVLLDQPRNLANVGAVVRAAAAAAAAAVLTTGEQDPWHPAALRGSAGLHFAQSVGAVTIDDLPDGRPLIGFDAAGAPFDPNELPTGAVLIFGSERQGLSVEARARCTSLAALPMRAGVSSLNLATSVAAVLMSWRMATGWTGR